MHPSVASLGKYSGRDYDLSRSATAFSGHFVPCCTYTTRLIITLDILRHCVLVSFRELPRKVFGTPPELY